MIRCFNCRALRPANAQGPLFRCFKCGAVTDVATGGPAGGDAEAPTPRTAGAPAPRSQKPTAARRLTIPQQRALAGFGRTFFGFLFLTAIMAGLCLWAAKHGLAIFRLNPVAHLALVALGPLILLLGATLAGALQMWLRQRQAQDLCAAIAPVSPGGPPRCDLCGNTLSARQRVDRCNSCGSHAVTIPAVTRRAGKRDVDIDENARRLSTDEAAYALSRLEDAVSRARRSVVVLPSIVLAVGAYLWLGEDWRMPATDHRPYAVVTTAECNIVIVSDGLLDDGTIGAARPDGMGGIPGKAGYADYSRYRGLWVLDRMPVAINALLRPDDFVGKHLKVRGAPHFGTVTGVYRREGDKGPQVMVDFGGMTYEGPLEESCVDVADPYRPPTVVAEAKPKPKAPKPDEPTADGAAAKAAAAPPDDDPLAPFRRKQP